jgi:hypothetical protein
VKILPLLILLLPVGCAPPAASGLTPSNAMICDAANVRADVGRRADTDARPRPECRPAPIAATR